MADPDGILGEIVARKRVDVGRRLGRTDISDLRSRARPTGRSLRAALAQPGARFILEMKRVSPSEGRLAHGAEPERIARQYSGPADAISVLVDQPFFGGSLEDLARVRAGFDGPILAKDFVIDPRQVVEARIHGADAVLVMLSVLDDAEARRMIDEAARLGMDILVEVHDESETRRAVALGASVIGINNRDLRTLTVDLAVTERLAGLVPPGRLLVSESGINGRSDVDRLADRADAFLVGSALMRSRRLGEAARALIFGRVKICGLTDAVDAAAAARAGASHIGLVFVPGTPRAVSERQAGPIVEAARTDGVGIVGVFRDAPEAEVRGIAASFGLDAVQLHGAEDAEYVRALRSGLPESTEIWAAIGMEAAMPRPQIGADRLLFDSGSGGTGRTFDWARLAGRPDLGRSVLAGGIGPDNVAAARMIGAWMMDVGSGVEAAPGRKDPARLQALFDRLRPPSRADAEMEDQRCA